MFRSTMRRTAVLVALATASAGLVAAPAEAREKLPSSLAIRAVKASIKPDTSGLITGALVVAGGGAAGKAVTLEAREKGEGEFTPIGVALSGPQGGVQLEVTPAATTRYRWDFDGDETTLPSRSGVVLVRVKDGRHHGLRLPTSLSIRAAEARVGKDGTTHIAGRLRSRGFPLVRKPVLLLSKEAGATKWSYDGAELTRARGQVAFSVSPSSNTRYRLAFLGSARFRAARSGVVTVVARSTALSISATPHFVDPGASAVVSGVLTHQGQPVAGQSVELRSKVIGSGLPFATAATAVTTAEGSVSFPVTPAAATRYRLIRPHTTGVPGARSAIATVRLKALTSISIVGKVYEQVYVVSGMLRGAGQGLAGRPVTLQRLAAGETTWSDVATTNAGAHGQVKFAQPIATGTSYRLSYAGGPRFAPSLSGVVVQ